MSAKLSKRDDLAEAHKQLDDASEYLRRKLTGRLRLLSDAPPGADDAAGRLTLPTIPDAPRSETPTIPEVRRRIA